MFKAIDTRTGQEIVILHPEWAAKLDDLRLLDQRDVLVCQGCNKPVRVRAGDVRRWHFAHKSKQDCTYGSDSPVLLEARAVLYEWLVSKFPQDVTLEKKVDDERLPRPIDCWVETSDGLLAYWIVESGMRPQKRETLKAGLMATGASVTWVLTVNLLNPVEEATEQFHLGEASTDCARLGTTERELLQVTRFDEAWRGVGRSSGASLHFLDSESKVLTTLRGLVLVHSPQIYGGHKECTPLAQIKIMPKTWEFVHPGEYERWQAYNEEKKQIEEQHRREQEQAEQLRQKTREQSRVPESARQVVLPAVEPRPARNIPAHPSRPHTPAATSDQRLPCLIQPAVSCLCVGALLNCTARGNLNVACPMGINCFYRKRVPD